MKAAKGFRFNAIRIFSFLILALLYGIVFFQRNCPAIVAEEMAESYHCQKADLNIFSAIFFYVNGLMQPFAGLLADVMEPAYLIGITQIIAGLGACICGFSNSILVGAIGRFLAGFGCGPTYVATCRFVANWFELKSYPFCMGVIVSIGCIVGILSQGPLALLISVVGWRNSFHIIGGTSFFLAIICMIFVRGNPVKKGYESVNKEMDDVKEVESLKEKFITLFKNLVTVLKYEPWFFLATAFVILAHGPYYNLIGMWGGPYLRDVMGYTKQKTGNTLIFITVGTICGAIYLPIASQLMKSRKWCLFVFILIVDASMIAFYIVGPDMPYWAVVLGFFLIGSNSFPNSTVAYSLVREYYHSSISGSAIGILNFFAQVVSGVYQEISKTIIIHYGEDSHDVYTWKGYKNGVWLMSVICESCAAFLCFFIKESNLILKQKEEEVLLISEPLIDSNK